MKNIVEILRDKPGFMSLKPAMEKQIEDAEKILQVKFSNDYRKYVASLGVASFFGHELTGISPSQRLNVVDVTIKERGYNPFIPADWYVIEQLNFDGIVIWQSHDGSIYQSAPNAGPQKINKDFAEYVALCSENLV